MPSHKCNVHGAWAERSRGTPYATRTPQARAQPDQARLRCLHDGRERGRCRRIHDRASGCRGRPDQRDLAVRVRDHGPPDHRAGVGPPEGHGRRGRREARTSPTSAPATTCGPWPRHLCTPGPGDTSYRTKAANGIDAAMGTEIGGDILDLTRNLLGYVLAADLIDLAGHDQAADQRFRTWLSGVRTLVLDGRTLISTHEDRPNNWGAHAGASRIAAAIYLGDWVDLDRAATVFRGWLGDRSAYAGFTYGDTSWQADPNRPVGVNAAGSTIDGHDVDGVLPDDQRRGGDFEWPPPCENYAREALQGVVVAATILTREGYPAFDWQDQALRRAGEWLRQVASCPFSGDDEFVPWLLNAAYGTNFATESPANSGKAMGFTAWTHGAFAGSGIAPRGVFIDDETTLHTNRP